MAEPLSAVGEGRSAALTACAPFSRYLNYSTRGQGASTPNPGVVDNSAPYLGRSGKVGGTVKGAPLPMPRYAGLSPRQATALSRQAFSDFPGLVVILKPLFRFLPLTEHTVPDGVLLIVCGPRGQKPWVTLDDAAEYPAFYVRVMEKFARFLPSPEDLEDDLDWADSEPLPVPNAAEEKIRLLKRP